MTIKYEQVRLNAVNRPTSLYASNDKVAVVELRCFGYQCFVVWSRSEGVTKARAFT